jgi:hypothetical protein
MQTLTDARVPYNDHIQRLRDQVAETAHQQISQGKDPKVQLQITHPETIQLPDGTLLELTITVKATAQKAKAQPKSPPDHPPGQQHFLNGYTPDDAD